MHHDKLAKKVAIAVAITAATALAPAAASAATVTRYVAPGGINGGPCLTEATACTLRHAVQEVAEADDTVQVAAGSYTQTIQLTVHASGVTIEGAPGARPVVDFPATLTNTDAVHTAYNTLTVRHLAVHADGDFITGISGNDLTLDDVDVQTPGSFTEAVVPSSASAISGSTLGSGPHGRALVLYGDSNALRHVTVWSSGTGISINNVGSAAHVALAVVHDSIVHGNENDIDLSAGSDISHAAAVNIDHSAYRPGAVVKNNQFAYLNDHGANFPDTPLLVDPAAGDLHETAGSPTIDKGSEESGDGTTDIDGEARVQGASSDAGADEFTVASALDDPPVPADPAPVPTDDAPAAPASTPSGGATPAGHAPAGGSTPGQSALPTAPVLDALRLTPSRFRVKSGRRGGTRVAYRVSAAATSSFTVQRRTTVKRHGRRTVRWASVKGSIGHRDVVGANAFAFTGKVGGRALRPGSYRLIAVARDSAGRVSATRRAAFRVTG